jgi:predicted alpha/beta hydrolase family esterase
MKRVFIIHGWEGTTKEGWYPWLKSKLEKRGFDAFALSMPESVERIAPWVNILQEAVGTPDKDTYFVGHSIGCQAILRYLEKLPAKTRVGGAVFVAGWFTLKGISAEDEQQAKTWLETPINLGNIKSKTKNMTAIFSDNDPYVPFEENKKLFEKFCNKIIVEKGKGHMNEESKTYELPSALSAVLELAKV